MESLFKKLFRVVFYCITQLLADEFQIDEKCMLDDSMEKLLKFFPMMSFSQGMYIKSTYDGLHVITGTTENVSIDNTFC